MGQPEPPVDIRLHLTDGTQIPAQSIHTSTEHGLHIWELIRPPGLDWTRVARVTVAAIPGNTEIRIPINGD